jgi:hypothetical protein
MATSKDYSDDEDDNWLKDVQDADVFVMYNNDDEYEIFKYILSITFSIHFSCMLLSNIIWFAYFRIGSLGTSSSFKPSLRRIIRLSLLVKRLFSRANNVSKEKENFT